MFSGSNATSLQQGLRNGTTVTLTGSGQSATFTPPTGHMGNGEVERAMTLASRDLAQAGITNPTPEQLEAAMMGGTVTNAQGQTSTLDGVLVLRSQGMGWGQIAQTIGVHPGQSEQAVAHSRRGGNQGAGALGSFSARDRSSQALSSSGDRDKNRTQVTRESRAAAVSSSSTTVNARAADRGNGSDRGRSAQATDRISAGSIASVGGRSELGAGRGNGRSNNASTASAVSTESVFSGPANAGPGAGKNSHANGKGKRGPGTADSGIGGPGVSAGGSMNASAGGTSAGSELGAGAGIGGGKGGGRK
ncbi:MAG: hypothetical protein HY527_11140 [Betaproteobacteria bacterium]|nr:hypothetical protein [Betaproteobacteria bacterium]